MTMAQIVIYLPHGACDSATMQKIYRHYPTAMFVLYWREGALMWQDALERITNSQGTK